MAAISWRRHGRMAATVLFAVLVLALIGYGLKSLLDGPSATRSRPPKIALLPATPPPPPPPPPKVEKKPEPPKQQEAVRLDRPDPRPEPAPDNTLKMEGDKGDGPSPFQAGTVTRENVIPGTSKGSTYAHYASVLQRYLQDELSRNKLLAGREYRVSLSLWFDAAGKVEKFLLTQTSGNAETDTLIQGALTGLPALRSPPPGDMPQPVRIRVTSRGTG